MISFLLFAVTVLMYIPALRGDFVNYDDGVYVTDNPEVQSGLNLPSIAWAFMTDHSGTWQPVTWLSHMLDCEVYGLKPWGHHLTSVMLHALNSVLLFLALSRLTGESGKSLFVAAVFALHPTHVESVAWVAERKDVLSTFFGFLAILSYALYAQKPVWQRHLFVSCWLLLSLMAKPMLVTLPFLFLLLDYWPLRRFAMDPVPALFRSVREKAPWFVMVAAFSLVTLATQHRAMSSLQALSIDMRVSNAFEAYLRYARNTFWPEGLAVFYPHPRQGLGVPGALFAATLLVVITAGCFFIRRRSPYLLVGWLWFVIALAPVIGIIQVGVQSMADRYSYVPSVGLSIMAAWGFSHLVNTPTATRLTRTRGAVLTAVAVVVLTLLAWRTWVQAGYWRDSETLFNRAVAVVDSDVAQGGLGKALMAKERYQDALPYLERAMRLNPGNPENAYNLGVAYQNLGRSDSAIAYYQEAIRLDAGYSKAHNNLGITLMGQGRLDEASHALYNALTADPSNQEAIGNYGAVLIRLGRPADAETLLRDALQRFPRNAWLHNNLAAALVAQGKNDEAKREFESALRLEPGFPEARKGLDALSGTPDTGP